MTKDQIMLLNRAVRALRDTSRHGYSYIDGVARCDIANLLVVLERENKALQKQLEAAQPKWFSAKENLPQNDDHYLVFTSDNNAAEVAIYYGDGEWLTRDLTNLTPLVTHWMPLPAPPKEVEQ